MATKENLQQVEYTLPYQQYVDPQVLKEEKKKIFYKSWIMVGHTSQVEKPGDFFTFDLAGEPRIGIFMGGHRCCRLFALAGI